jgi:hypothetical protein
MGGHVPAFSPESPHNCVLCPKSCHRLRSRYILHRPRIASSKQFLDFRKLPSSRYAPLRCLFSFFSCRICCSVKRPLAAQTKARAMPVFPLVGSRMMVSPLICPACSAASIIETPMRSFTLLKGLKDSIFTSTVASKPLVTLFNLTSGVLPMVLVRSA